MTEVIATHCGTRAFGIKECRFLVPSHEYAVGCFGFVIDPDRHALYDGPSGFVGVQGRDHMIEPPRRQALLLRMGAAHRETRRHLDLIHRQKACRAERMTATEKAKGRSHKRSASLWTRCDDVLCSRRMSTG
ncbi:hypothetical protein [Xaviernesmea rhizosphaerae]|uniref:hypothetical protein n=1 Tax=Xaviernesmea rhizosphaerae TaxID=1672749 RepID=UPI003159FC70